MRLIRKHPKSRQHAIYYTTINTFTNIAHSTASLYASTEINPYQDPRLFRYYIYTKRPFKYYFPWKNTLNLNNNSKRYEHRLRPKSYIIKCLSSFRVYYNITISKINSKRNKKR